MAVEMKGFAETMRDLGKIEPAMKREVFKDIRGIVKPVVHIINARIPSAPPISGMDHNGRTGWRNIKKVAVKIDTRGALCGKTLTNPSTLLKVNCERQLMTRSMPPTKN